MDSLINVWLANDPDLTPAADRCLDRLIYSPDSPELRDSIIIRKFEGYNEEWLDRLFAIQNSEMRRSSGLKKELENDNV